MTYSPVTASVLGSPLTANFVANVNHPANETAATAVKIGDLEQQNTVINISDQGAAIGASSSTNFSLQDGDALFLKLSETNLLNEVEPPRIQVSDSNGNIVADNQGTVAQQNAFIQLTSPLASSGLTPGAGNYTVTVTPAAGASGSGTAFLNAISTQGTTLNVNSQLTSGDPSEYYNFSFGQGNNLKLAFDPGNNSSSTDVQLYDGNGVLVADSRGNNYLKNNYSQLTSGTGLSTAPGNYTVKVSYAKGISADQNINYNFQLYSGTSYAVKYTTNATAPAANNTAAGSITPADQTALFSRNAYNSVVNKATSGVNIGWLQENKTSLSVQSLITSFNSTDFYNFTLQTGNNLKFAFANTTNTSNLQVQILNSTGTGVIADNQGTEAQQAAYKQLTSSTGLTAKPGQYVVKVTYPQSDTVRNQQQYNFQLYSGTSYSSHYTTIASAQSYENALLSGNVAGGFNSAVAAASYLNNVSNGAAPDILSVLSTVA